MCIRDSISIIASPIQIPDNNISEELSTASLEHIQPDDILTTSRIQDMNKIESDGASSSNGNGAIGMSRTPLKFEIHIVKVRIVGLAGVHFKKVSGNTWLYKELASHILKDLNL